jgi:hypothetical protein
VNDYAEKLRYMWKADQGIRRVPVRVVRGENGALQALQADFAPLHVQVMREERAVGALFAFAVGAFEVLLWDRWQL